MTELLFYIFASLTLASGLLVVTSRNPVNAAMFMILSFVGTASIFVLLEAYFLAVLQILVYAGAVMVLFLFIIMLLNVDKASKVKPSYVSFSAAIFGFLLLALGVGYFFAGDLSNGLPEVGIDINPEAPFAFTTSVKSFGYGLFTKYMLPFQVTGFLLLAAMIGVIVICKNQPREQKEEE